MKFCHNCGSPIPDQRMGYCVSCGQKIYRTGRGRAWNKYLLIFSGGLVALAIPVIALLVLKANSESSALEQPTTNYSQEGSSNTVANSQVRSEINSPEESEISGLKRLKELQDDIVFTVLAPSYLPTDFKLNSSTVKAEISGSAASNDGTFLYEINRNTDQSLRFGGNAVGNPSVAWNKQIMEIRGHKGLVYSEGKSVSFERSNFYFILWNEQRDLTDAYDLKNSYFIDTKSVEWSEVEKILNGLEPVNNSNAMIPVMNSLESISFPGRYEDLKNTNFPFLVLIPSVIPDTAKCAWIKTEPSVSYRIEFYSKACSAYKVDYKIGPDYLNAPMADYTGGITASFGMSNCSMNDNSDYQITTVRGQEAFYKSPTMESPNQGLHNLFWCENDAQYSVSTYSKEKAVLLSNSFQNISDLK